MLKSILTEKYRDKEYLQKLNHKFEEDKIVILDNLFSDDVFNFFVEEGKRLKKYGKSRDFILDKFDTRRNITTIGGEVFQQYSQGLCFFYRHVELQELLEVLTGGPIYSSNNSYEWGVYNITEGKGKTLGWHLDDPSHVLVITLEENLRDKNKGGSLEYISQWVTLCEQYGYDRVKNVESFKKEGYKMPSDIHPMINKAREKEMISELYLSARQAYLFKTEGIMHRVKPIETDDGYRTAILFSFQDTPYIEYYEDGKQIYD